VESVTDQDFHYAGNAPRTIPEQEKEKEKQLPTRRKQLSNKA
jgi:hypothetical protein